ncbi:YciI family protein [Aureibaculum sp. 2210JD6-5]|uniref:YciI family protein n=1 Tax=Aureibaculum sp. 2210JD6-5 TaxID=3103957 RepID=UPI002AAC63DD|nr:YciI family protein [Aureibaculum sp. 2210JD6-5]MDY7395354.1 YciI family protein [Aureibaculum sp. 2210JD6-5]
MSNFLYLFRGGDEEWSQQSPEQIQAHMQKWGAWMGGLKEKGQLVDGLPLNKEGKVVREAGEIVTDGPFTEGTEVVGGYLIVTANDLNHAVEISKGCPIFDYEGSHVEVREIMSMDM